MEIQEELDALKASIIDLPTRDDIYCLLEIIKEYEQPEKDEAISSFLSSFSTKDKIMEDLLSYPNYLNEQAT